MKKGQDTIKKRAIQRIRKPFLKLKIQEKCPKIELRNSPRKMEHKSKRWTVEGKRKKENQVSPGRHQTYKLHRTERRL